MHAVLFCAFCVHFGMPLCFGIFVSALGRTCCLSSRDVVCMVVHSGAYFMHAQGCVQFGIQHALACLCLLPFCIFVVLHALVIHVWAYFLHAIGM